MSSVHDQVIALSGLLQCCYFVDQVAQTGHCEADGLETAVSSLFVTDPSTTLAVYGSLSHLEQGLELSELLTGKSKSLNNSHWVRYALTVLHLEPKLKANSEMLNHVSKGIAQAESPKRHFGLMHDNTLASLARTYQETISTFNTRIQVNGQPQILQIEQNAAKIRVLLLAAMRSAILWRQAKGHRWHFLFKRQKLHTASCQLLQELSSQSCP